MTENIGTSFGLAMWFHYSALVVSLLSGIGIADKEFHMSHTFLKKDQVLAFIDAIPEGQIFSVVFEKADGTLRRMQCKQGVQKFLKGGDATYAANPDNVGVFDTEAKPKNPMIVDGKVQQGDYRCFNSTRVLRVRGSGAELKSYKDEITDPVVNARGEVVKV